MSEKKQEPVYIMVPRKLLITYITTTLVLFIGIIANFQYTNYVDRRSNGFWCGIITLFDNTYDTNPPISATGATLAREFNSLNTKLKCK